MSSRSLPPQSRVRQNTLLLSHLGQMCISISLYESATAMHGDYHVRLWDCLCRRLAAFRVRARLGNWRQLPTLSTTCHSLPSTYRQRDLIAPPAFGPRFLSNIAPTTCPGPSPMHQAAHFACNNPPPPPAFDISIRGRLCSKVGVQFFPPPLSRVKTFGANVKMQVSRV